MDEAREIHRAAALSFDPSANHSFGVFDASGYTRPEYARCKVVVVGGGTGAPMSIRACTALGFETSAIVTMADDGGSTGIIRAKTDATPPGDIRKCLAAFARDPHDPMVRAFSARLSFAENHALGNLLLVALEETAGDFLQAIALCERLLDAQGHVLPSTLCPVTLRAQRTDGTWLEGQKAACESTEALHRIELTSSENSVRAVPAAIEACEAADLIILGPGSLFTSIVSNLAVPGIAEVIASSQARVVYVCSVADTQGETRGMSVLDHVEALERHGLSGALDFVLVNNRELIQPQDVILTPVLLTSAMRASLAHKGIELIEAPLADGNRPTWHNPRALCRGIAEVMDRCLSRKA